MLRSLLLALLPKSGYAGRQKLRVALECAVEETLVVERLRAAALESANLARRQQELPGDGFYRESARHPLALQIRAVVGDCRLRQRHS